MKQLIENLIKNSISSLDKDGSVNSNLVANIRVDRTKDRAHGDFATNIAMILAKPLKKNPRQIAEDIIASLPKDNHISKVEIAGPGFINFFVNKDAISKALKDMSADPRLGIPKVITPKTIVVDYSAPNVAKEMAVHHIRSTVIGDAVVRVLEFLGNNVIRANHIGDWGTQFGMLIAYLEKKKMNQVKVWILATLKHSIVKLKSAMTLMRNLQLKHVIMLCFYKVAMNTAVRCGKS